MSRNRRVRRRARDDLRSVNESHREVGRQGWVLLRWTKSDLDDHAAKTLAELRDVLRERA
ncbi:hypothetical protein P9139_07350 [Curtobacterium flaccumfaciens]|nr:hypothetical protein P9139_07350 [Curtobacterium flaccumfaciens]